MRGFFQDIIIRRLASVGIESITVADNGSWSILADEETVKGSFHHTRMYEREPDNMGQYGQRIIAVARLPLSVEVTSGDQIVLVDRHPSVDGVYEIEAVMLTPTHQRCEVRKISTP